MPKNTRLGKGIDALLQGRDLTQLEGDLASVVTVPVGQLHPNPDQPRRTFNEEALAELAQSIEDRGVIQPILAEQQDDGDYLIIAGERRWRAAKMAGLSIVPVLPGVFSEQEKLEIALVENIQRQDLTPLEEARAYQELITRRGLSQEDLARRLGKSRPAIANSLRLLRLAPAVQDMVEAGTLSAGHGRTLLGLEKSTDEQLTELANLIATEHLSVRDVERLVHSVNHGSTVEAAIAAATAPAGAPNSTVTPATPSDTGTSSDPTGTSDTGTNSSSDQPASGTNGTGGGGPAKTVEVRSLEEDLIRTLGTRVNINGSPQKGRIEITYHSMEDLERLAELMLGRKIEN